MSIMDKLGCDDVWQEFIEYKVSGAHFSEKEEKELRRFVEKRGYLPVLELIEETLRGGKFTDPRISEISKKGTDKKRKVFVFPRAEGYVFKLMSYLLHKYDGLFEKNLFSFRHGLGVKDAVNSLLSVRGISKKYTYKVDIHDYFNSVDTERIISILESKLPEDETLVRFLSAVLRQRGAKFEGRAVEADRGIMAGVAVSGFLANLYLSEMDAYFSSRGIPYSRYSDDVIVFADTAEQIAEYERVIKAYLSEYQLEVNEKKEFRTRPGERWEYLGFSFLGTQIDISPVSFEKIKAKMRRKARSLLRWKNRKGEPEERAMRSFIKHFNSKLYDNPTEGELTWALWYFPMINTPKTLHLIDEYAQDCIRYIATGRHSKSNYRITYEKIKSLGYRNLVNSYYRFKKTGQICPENV